MKKDEVTIGMLVAVNDLNDGVVYTVAEKDGFLVKLTYRDGLNNVVSAGIIDVYTLRKPTKKQLKNANLS